jgi:N-acylneuraminate cytidylyltransferase
MIAWVITTALQSGCFSEVMVSTEDEEIAHIAKAFGALVPFRRSLEHAGDHSTTEDVLREVLRNYTKQGQSFPLACCLYPTAALLSPERLVEGHSLLLSDPNLVSVIAVSEYAHPIQRALTFEQGRLNWAQPEFALARTQDLPKRFHDAGQFYWFRSEPLMAGAPLVGFASAAVVLPPNEVQDIDQESDWKIAETLFRLQKEPL